MELSLNKASHFSIEVCDHRKLILPFLTLFDPSGIKVTPRTHHSPPQPSHLGVCLPHRLTDSAPWVGHGREAWGPTRQGDAEAPQET